MHDARKAGRKDTAELTNLPRVRRDNKPRRFIVQSDDEGEEIQKRVEIPITEPERRSMPEPMDWKSEHGGGWAEEKRKGKRVASPSSTEESSEDEPYVHTSPMDTKFETKKQPEPVTQRQTRSRRVVEELKEVGYTEKEAKKAQQELEKEKKKKSEKEDKDSKKAYAALKAMGVKGTFYPHTGTLRNLGLTEEVDKIFDALGVKYCMYNVASSYIEETLQFLATIYFGVYPKTETEVIKKNGPGLIRFTIHGKEYSVTLKRLDKIFGFRAGEADYPGIEEVETDEVWSMLTGVPAYNASRSKGNWIRNPAINYARRAIANVMFARPSTSPITLGEMQMMVMAMKEIVGVTATGRDIDGDDANSGLSFVLADHLPTYRARALTQAKRKTGNPKHIYIGGVITRILEDVGVPLNTEKHNWVPPQFMDVQYLQGAGLLDKSEVQGRAVYKFKHPEKTDARILLPCPEFTRLNTMENVSFTPPLAALLGEHQRGHVQQAAEEANEEEEDPEAYFFEEFTERNQGVASKEAHKRIGKLQKLGKWLLKKVKGLTKEKDDWLDERKKMWEKINELDSSLRRTEPQPRQPASPPAARRHSTAADSSSQQVQPEQPRRQSVDTTKVYKRSMSRARKAHSQKAQEGPSQAPLADQTREEYYDWQQHAAPMEGLAPRGYPNPQNYTLEDMNASTAHLFDF